MLDFSGTFDREKMYWKDLENVVFGCACAPPGGGRNPLTARFVKCFRNIDCFELYLYTNFKYTIKHDTHIFWFCRFVRHFALLLLSPPNDATLTVIFRAIISG